MTEQNILTVDAVSKYFDGVTALDHVNLSIRPGARVALLGHNGAGKTTLFRLILGFIKPDQGSIKVVGHAPGHIMARRSLAYLPENVAFPETLTGREIMHFFARLKDVDAHEAVLSLARVGLEGAGDRRVRTYSKGMRQRLGLAQALLGAPRLLLLDEPTSGLDPLVRREFYNFFDELSAAGTSILFSSHGLSELADKTDRLLILRAGGLVADGSLQELRAQAALPIRIRVKAVENRSDELAARLGGQRINGRQIDVMCAMGEQLEKVRQVSALRGLVCDMEIRPPSLTDIYQYFSMQPGAS